MNYDPRVKTFLVDRFGDTARVSHAELSDFLQSLGLPVNSTIALLKADEFLFNSKDPQDRPTAHQLATGTEPRPRYRIAESVVRMSEISVDDLLHDCPPENLSLGRRPMEKQIDPKADSAYGFAWPAFPLDLEKLKHDGFVAGDCRTSAKLVERPGRPGTLDDLRSIYAPTEEDKALIESLYPDMDSEEPLWWRIRADLINNGMDVSSLAALTAPGVVAVLKRSERERSPTNDAMKHPKGTEPLRPFHSGEMVFYEDRVELCGVAICNGKRSRTRRRILELLAQTDKTGRFISYSLERLTELANPKGGSGTITGAVRDLRCAISESLETKARIECGRLQVILSGGAGYRFAECLSVQRAEQAITDITDIDDSDDVRNVRNDDVLDVLNVRNDEAETRKAWILQQLRDGVQLKAPMVAAHFNRSKKTAQRDLDALRDEAKIEFVGDPRTGYYRLCQPPRKSP